MTALLILTIGSGTKGEHSNLAQGLVNTLNQLRPRPSRRSNRTGRRKS